MAGQELPNNLLTVCVEQVTLALESMVGLEFQFGELSRPGGSAEAREIYSAMNLDGDLPGCMMIALDRKLAVTIVSEMLMAEPDEIEEDLLDGIGEILNVVVGNAKTALAPQGISILLRTPDNMEGAPPKDLDNKAAPGVVLHGTVSGQTLSLWVWLPGADENVLEDCLPETAVEVEPQVEAAPLVSVAPEEVQRVSPPPAPSTVYTPPPRVIVLGRATQRSLQTRYFAGLPHAFEFVDHWQDVLRGAMNEAPLAVLIEEDLISEQPDVDFVFQLAATWPVLRFKIGVTGSGELIRGDGQHRGEISASLREVANSDEAWLPPNEIRTELRISLLSRARFRVVGDESWHQSNTLNMGPRGVFLVCYEPPPVESEVEVIVMDVADDEMSLQGRVLWTRNWHDSVLLPGAGIRLEPSRVGVAALNKLGLEVFADEIRRRHRGAGRTSHC